MTKRLYTAEKVLEAVLEDLDDDQDYDDPDEPVMEGSDDEFSDLEQTMLTLTNYHQTLPHCQ
jgi:hypothetical protein